MIRLLSALTVVSLAFVLAGEDALAQSGGRPGRFDYYVLSLSWSPSYCEAAGERANRRQCATGRPFAFVVHGLWPQFERGWPQFCRTKRQVRLRRDEIDSILDIMPSRGLIRHQWKKHGTCSGLSPARYFDTVRRAWKSIQIPQSYAVVERYTMVDPRQVERQFVDANPGLSKRAIAVTCDRRRLREVRICMDKSLRFRTCPAVDSRGCRQRRVMLPPVRAPR